MWVGESDVPPKLRNLCLSLLQALEKYVRQHVKEMALSTVDVGNSHTKAIECYG